MKKLLLIGAICSLTQLGFSQSIIHNKLTVEIGTSMDGFAGADKFMDEFFSGNWTRYDSYFERVNRQVLDLRFYAQYRVARKLSVEVGTASKTYENQFNYIVYNNITGSDETTPFTFSLNRRSYNFGVNLFVGNSLAPLGTHIGLFYAINNYSATNLKEHYAFLQRSKSPSFSGIETPNYVVHHLGLKIGSVSAISKKIPVYLKYGATFALPINSFIQDNNVTLKTDESYELGVSNHDEYGLFDQLIEKEYINLYLGIGFMF